MMPDSITGIMTVTTGLPTLDMVITVPIPAIIVGTQAFPLDTDIIITDITTGAGILPGIILTAGAVMVDITAILPTGGADLHSMAPTIL